MLSSIPSRLCATNFRHKKTQQDAFRGMATLKAISIRLKSVKNIQKITQSMKMVSAAKFARAERDLKAIKPIGEGAKKFYEKCEVGVDPEKPDAKPDEKAERLLYVAVTSDRGLCGAVHTSVVRHIRHSFKENGEKIKVVCIGDKARSMLHRTYGSQILFVVNEVGRTPPTFLDASRIANEILQSDYKFDLGRIVYNRFRSVVSYNTETMPLYRLETVMEAPKISNYEIDAEDEEDATEVMVSFIEFSMASMLFYAMKEGATSEQSSRMTAMDNASKNAGEMIDKLTLTFNRTRQAVITRELIEIISGASAL